MFLIFSAFAQDAGTTAVTSSGFSGFNLMGFVPFVLMFGVLYLFIIRPQQKKMKAHQLLTQNVRRGDKVLTAGGLIGTVHKVLNDEEVSLELEEGIRVRLIKTAISQVMAKTEPLKIKDDLGDDLDPTHSEGGTDGVVSFDKKLKKNKK